MISVVLDTSVAVSGLLWPGPPMTLLEYAQAGRCRIMATHAMLAEITRVLQRDKFVRRFAQLHASYEQPLHFYFGLVRLCPPPPRAACLCEDPGDQMFIDLAVAARAHLLVSGDQHLLRMRAVHDIPIVRVHEALGVLRAL